MSRTEPYRGNLKQVFHWAKGGENEKLVMADKYKNKVPKKVYDALLEVEVRPY